MEKYKSKLIKSKDLIVETNRYYDENFTRHEIVKLTYTPLNIISVAIDSKKGQVDAYNSALKEMEKRIQHFFCPIELDLKAKCERPCNTERMKNCWAKVINELQEDK